MEGRPPALRHTGDHTPAAGRRAGFALPAIDPEVVKKVPAKFAYHYKMIPIGFKNNILIIGVSDPTDMHTLDDIRLLLGCEIDPEYYEATIKRIKRETSQTSLFS